MNWYDWFATYFVVPRVLAALQPQISELQTAMSKADDQVAQLTTDLAATNAKVDALIAAFGALQNQLQNETGLSPASLQALADADALVVSIGAKADAANPPAPVAPPDQPTS